MTEGDQGTYKCSATNGRGLQDHDEKEINYSCVRPSHVIIHVGTRHPDGYAVGNNQNVLWTCEAEGTPAPEFTWVKDGGRATVSNESALM